MLSTFRPNDLRQCVIEEDIFALTRVSGIGKKTAQHIFLELKYKLQIDGNSTTSSSPSIGQSLFYDILTGLQGLGYTKEESSVVIKSVLQHEPDLDVGSALRRCLKQLVKG